MILDYSVLILKINSIFYLLILHFLKKSASIIVHLFDRFSYSFHFSILFLSITIPLLQLNFIWNIINLFNFLESICWRSYCCLIGLVWCLFSCKDGGIHRFPCSTQSTLHSDTFVLMCLFAIRIRYRISTSTFRLLLLSLLALSWLRF